MDDTWTDAGPSDTLHTYARALLRIAGLEIAVFKQGDQLWAVEDSCPHAGASLCGGKVQDGQVRCPAHGLTFDLLTGQMRGGGLAVRVFAIRDINGRLQMRLPPTITTNTEEAS